MFVRQAGGRHPQPAAGPKLWRTPTAHDRRAWAAGRGPRSTSKMIRACREGDDAHAQAAHDAALGAVPQAPREVGWARVALSRRVTARRAALRAWARPRAWIPGTSPAPQANWPQRALGRSTGPRSRTPIASETTPAFGAGYRRLSVAWRALATDEDQASASGRSAPGLLLDLWEGSSAAVAIEFSCNGGDDAR